MTAIKKVVGYVYKFQENRAHNGAMGRIGKCQVSQEAEEEGS